MWPTENGTYWVQPKGSASWETAELFCGTWWVADGDFSPQWMEREYTAGPRIPSPEELEAMKEDIKMVLNVVMAGRGSPVWGAVARLRKVVGDE